jgi:hypothetical protein
MNNLSSYCGLVDAKIRASDKDLPVPKIIFAHCALCAKVGWTPLQIDKLISFQKVCSGLFWSLLVANFEAYLILNVPPPQLHIQKVHAT